MSKVSDETRAAVKVVVVVDDNDPIFDYTGRLQCSAYPGPTRIRCLLNRLLGEILPSRIPRAPLYIDVCVSERNIAARGKGWARH
jgi:hypothetical protein